MKHFKIQFLLLALSLSPAFGQDTAELARRNGFKDIKLGSPVDSIKGAVFQKDITVHKEFPAKVYEVKNPNYKKVGDVDVKKLVLHTYKGLIFEIIVTTAKDPQIMKGLAKSFGDPIFNIRTETYYWRAIDALSLTYKGHHKEIQLTYRSAPVAKMMYADKGKKIEEIAEDF